LRETENSGILLARDRREGVGRDQSLSNAVADVKKTHTLEEVHED
jgi:hypothetical protein